jgi:hypothetical protein
MILTKARVGVHNMSLRCRDSWEKSQKTGSSLGKGFREVVCKALERLPARNRTKRLTILGIRGICMLVPQSRKSFGVRWNFLRDTASQ